MSDPKVEPEFMLDGARVVHFAFLDASRGPYHTVVNGMPVDSSIVTRLVIAEDLVEGGVHLLHCNSDWETVAASRYDDAGEAKKRRGRRLRERRAAMAGVSRAHGRRAAPGGDDARIPSRARVRRLGRTSRRSSLSGTWECGVHSATWSGRDRFQDLGRREACPQ